MPWSEAEKLAVPWLEATRQVVEITAGTMDGDYHCIRVVENGQDPDTTGVNLTAKSPAARFGEHTFDDIIRDAKKELSNADTGKNLGWSEADTGQILFQWDRDMDGLGSSRQKVSGAIDSSGDGERGFMKISPAYLEWMGGPNHQARVPVAALQQQLPQPGSKMEFADIFRRNPVVFVAPRGEFYNPPKKKAAHTMTFYRNGGGKKASVDIKVGNYSESARQKKDLAFTNAVLNGAGIAKEDRPSFQKMQFWRLEKDGKEGQIFHAPLFFQLEDSQLAGQKWEMAVGMPGEKFKPFNTNRSVDPLSAAVSADANVVLAERNGGIGSTAYSGPYRVVFPSLASTQMDTSHDKWRALKGELFAMVYRGQTAAMDAIKLFDKQSGAEVHGAKELRALQPRHVYVSHGEAFITQ